jgi:nucleoside-diphosphate-sugar epimerase
MQEQSRPLVLITGSSGFLGQAIAGGLIGAGYRVIGLDVRQPRTPLDKMKTIEIDLTSDASVAGALDQVRQVAGERIASVIHLAAYYDTTGEDNPKYGQVTVDGTRRLLDALKRFELEQFVFSSTMLVHAPSPEKGVTINEDSPLDPAWAYPRSKAVTEALIRSRRDGVKSVILRFAGVYDEDCRAAFLAQQIARIFERLPTAYLFAGDISSGQPYVHRDDLVDAVVRAVDRRAALPDETTLLIGEEETPSYQELQGRLGRLIHGESWRTLALPEGSGEARRLDAGRGVRRGQPDQAVDGRELRRPLRTRHLEGARPSRLEPPPRPPRHPARDGAAAEGRTRPTGTRTTSSTRPRWPHPGRNWRPRGCAERRSSATSVRSRPRSSGTGRSRSGRRSPTQRSASGSSPRPSRLASSMLSRRQSRLPSATRSRRRRSGTPGLASARSSRDS